MSRRILCPRLYLEDRDIHPCHEECYLRTAIIPHRQPLQPPRQSNPATADQSERKHSQRFSLPRQIESVALAMRCVHPQLEEPEVELFLHHPVEKLEGQMMLVLLAFRISWLIVRGGTVQTCCLLPSFHQCLLRFRSGWLPYQALGKSFPRWC